MLNYFGSTNILSPVELAEIDDPTLGSVEYDAAVQRDKTTRDISAMPWLPQLPDEWAYSIFERIEAAERTYAAPNLQEDEYAEGTAKEDDDIAVVRTEGNKRHLFSAEHATKPFSLKTKQLRNPDSGTAGLAAVLAEDYGTAIIMRGRQTSNVPSDPGHPIRPYIEHELQTADSFLSLHGKNPGMFVHPVDEAEIHACIGLGIEPSEALMEFAKKIVLQARDDLGLYTVISNNQAAYIQQENSTKLKRLEDGSVKQSRLAALGEHYTTNSSRRYLNSIGHDRPTLQLEITRLLRLDYKNIHNIDRKSLIMGVARGFKLVEMVVRLVPQYESRDA